MLKSRFRKQKLQKMNLDDQFSNKLRRFNEIVDIIKNHTKMINLKNAQTYQIFPISFLCCGFVVVNFFF